jgi:hypothetical protein
MNLMQFADVVRDFRVTVESSSASLMQMSGANVEQPRSEGKWSAKQVIGHLIDSAANNHSRFVRAQLTDDLNFQGYEQGRWVELQHYQDESWPDLVQLWRAYNLHLAHVMSCVPSEILTKPRLKHSLQNIAWDKVGEAHPVTLEYLMRDYVGHLKHHLSQILPEERSGTAPRN